MMKLIRASCNLKMYFFSVLLYRLQNLTFNNR